MWRNANLSLNVALVRNDPHATGGTARWRWIISSCGMPACVTTQGSSRSPKGSLAYIYIYIKMCFLALQHFFSLPAAVFPRALGSVASREPARTPYASLDPSRGPWDVLLGFKVARPLGDAFRSPRAIQAHVNQRTENVMNRLKNVRPLMWYLGSWMSSLSSDVRYLVMETLFLDTNSPTCDHLC